AAGVATSQSTSRVTLDANQLSTYSVSYKPTGPAVPTHRSSDLKFILDTDGNVQAVDSFKLTTAQQAAMKTDINNFSQLDTDAAGAATPPSTPRASLDANQHPTYYVSFKTTGAGAGSDVDSLSKF